MTRVSDNRLERVARAMGDIMPTNLGNMTPWGKRPEEERELYRMLARAAIDASNDLVGEMEKALKAADKRLCELTPIFQPDGPSTLAEAEEIEETGAVVMQIRTTLARQTYERERQERLWSGPTEERGPVIHSKHRSRWA